MYIIIKFSVSLDSSVKIDSREKRSRGKNQITYCQSIISIIYTCKKKI